MIDLRGKRALVMGLGVHGGGLGVARFLVGQGADVTVTDLRGPEVLKPSLDALAGLPISYVLGEHREADFRSADLVIRNPGVPRESRYLQIARAAGAAIEMEMTLFFRLCPGPILGITGTKGKTTTTLLAGTMLRQQYPNTVVAGNLRVSAIEALPRITAGTPVVLELSSWQLEGLGEAQFSPQYACVTNLSPDHLNRYGSMADYAEAKKQIVLWQRTDGVAILNGSDPLVRDFARAARGAVALFYDGEPPESDLASIADQELNAVIVGDTDIRTTFGKTGARWQRICMHDEVALPGRHNLVNVAAASLLALMFGVTLEHIRAAIHSFPGIEHRLEFVRELAGVRYINDTTATAPEAAIAALHSFKAPIVLIAGGADKDLPFDGMARAIVERAKALVLLNGTATPKLQSAISSQQAMVGESEAVFDHQLPTVIGPFDNFAQAIAAARDLAVPGDVVLLSPGCASFGMFLNEFQRGDEFRRIVNQF